MTLIIFCIHNYYLYIARDTGISNGNGTPPVPAVQPDPVDATGTESTDPGIDRANEEEKHPGIVNHNMVIA